uniref:Uncharacterized protein n=1 Tax=Caenorhabditis japonica TaxID=281687 RepID=A0A8R1ISS0_CAEJA
MTFVPETFSSDCPSKIKIYCIISTLINLSSSKTFFILNFLNNETNTPLSAITRITRKRYYRFKKSTNSFKNSIL